MNGKVRQKDAKVIRLSEKEFRKLNIVVRSNTKVVNDDGTSYWIPKEKNFNDIIDENKKFYFDNHVKGPLMLVTHKKLTDEEWNEIRPSFKHVPDEEDKKRLAVICRFDYESFRIKYYNRVAEDFVYYPGYENRHYSNLYNYHFCCSGEEIVVRKVDVDKVYLIDLDFSMFEQEK